MNSSQMRFRVTTIQDAGLSDELNHACLFLEDWINHAAGDADFGWSAGSIMVVVFATSSLPKPPAASRLVGNSGDAPLLALHVVVDPMAFEEANASSALAHLSEGIVRGLPEKPVRKPQSLDFARLRSFLMATVAPFGQHAAVQPFVPADGFAAR
ncbi:hypothetical protein [Paracidovorax avenae]|uniref:hypothetical protein n=2 Tax=Paracidovorax avenae TaxID=80867 RepID=UPI0012600F0C|nr:hypothetical protein [Paracidovorax avenae]